MLPTAQSPGEDSMANSLPDSAAAVVIGGGIMGCSTAYHLAKLGARNVVLIERSKLTSGTTWHSAAQVRQLRSTISLTQLTQYSAKLYASLAQETGQETGWRQCGSISIATNPDRLVHIRRQASLARAFGIEVHEIDTAELRDLWPVLNVDDVIGAVYSPSDGRVNPSDVCAALIKGARAHGARIYEDTAVTGFQSMAGRVSAVQTTGGTIRTDRVAVCAGLWSRQVAGLAGVWAPLHACEHFALITKPIAGIDRMMPILGDHDGHMYMREESQGLLVGCFEPNARPIALEQLPADFSFDLLSEDWQHFEPIMKLALHRVPALEDAEVRMLLNGPESFTPDGAFLLGEAPALGGFFLGCGMNSMGIASGGGAGRALAEWMLAGEPTMDLWAVDIRRFGRFHNNLNVVRERAAEHLSRHYVLSTPGHEAASVRDLRLSPLHHCLAEKGAWFGERAGWERPNVFLPGSNGSAPALRFGRPAWHEAVAKEHQAARQAVALFDQSQFGKLLIQGRHAEAFLQRLCAGDMAVPPGRAVYTPMLNQRGGYESECVVMRLDERRFMLITGAAQAVRDYHWLESHLSDGEFVTLTDITAGLGVIGIMGPKSRDLLRCISSADFSNAAFPYFSHREIDIGNTVARAARLSYVGELGWEIYLPTDQAVTLYRQIEAAGEAFGLRDGGSFAMAGLRLEKGFCSWGHDIGPDDTPLEAGLGFSLGATKETDFIGRQAILRQRDQGLEKRRVIVLAEDPELHLMGGEPILADGKILGRTTSVAYGHTIARSLGMGFIRVAGQTIEELLSAACFELEVACRRLPATAQLEAPYDPTGARMRADG